MINVDLSNVTAAQDGERRGLAPGGYVCGITRIENISDKQYLRLEFDIAEGENKNYYRRLYQTHGFWGGSFIRSYKEKALPFFKGFVTCVEKSNPGYRWNGDENGLHRKLIGLVLGEEEYERSETHEIKKRLIVTGVRCIDDIRNGNFTVPELKKLDRSTLGNSYPAPDYSYPAPSYTNQGMSFQEAPLILNEDDLPF